MTCLVLWITLRASGYLCSCLRTLGGHWLGFCALRVKPWWLWYNGFSSAPWLSSLGSTGCAAHAGLTSHCSL